MKIIRCLWGKQNHQFIEKNLDFFHQECHKAKEFDEKYNLINQMVIVWDEINCELLEKLGYPYLYMGPSMETTYGFNFYHKIIALKRAMELYDEILFLDWDCYIQKPLDEKFFLELRNGNDIQLPLYFYPEDLIKPFETINPKCNEGMNYYNLLFYNMVRYGKWEFDSGLVIPNAGFIYCRDKEFFNKIDNIQKVHGITTNIEEICSMIYFNDFIKTTDEYIEKIEPKVCNGKIDSEMFGKQYILNNYTMKKLNKDIYFIHE